MGSERDRAGNTLNQARNISLGADPKNFSEKIGGSDLNDYYKFSVGSRSTFYLQLKNLTADANVELLNRSGQVIDSSTRTGTFDEFISATLNAGTYYVRVFPASPSDRTRYTLEMSAPRDVGDTLETAKRIQIPSRLITSGEGAGTGTFRDRIDPGAGDFNDYYRFTLDSRKTLNLDFRGRNLEILNSRGEVVGRYFVGIEFGSPVYVLDAGTYYFRVFGDGPNLGEDYSFSAYTSVAPGDSPANAPTLNPTIDTSILLRGIARGNPEEGGSYYRFAFEGSRDLFFTWTDPPRLPPVVEEILDESGKVVEPVFSRGRSFTATEVYSLKSGVYYLRFASVWSGGVSYYASVSLSSDPGNNLTSAFRLAPPPIESSSQFSQKIHQFVSRDTDPVDYYRFTLPSTSNIFLSLDDLDEMYDGNYPSTKLPEMKIQLLDNRGRVIDTSTDSESGISRRLNAGTYYVRASLESGVATDYFLNIRRFN